MKFRILDNDGNDVMGAPVCEDNVYIRAYGVPRAGEKRPLDLAIGETSKVQFSLSGTKGTYLIVREE